MSSGRQAILLVVVLALGMAGMAAEPPRPKLAFQVLSGEESGLKAIMEKWKEEELKRQGGKFGSHGWWPWGLAAFDFDNDGCLDLLAQQHGAPGSIILRGQFKEKGKVRFVNVTEELGVGSTALPGTSKPRIWDVDGDGWLDIVGSDAKPNSCFFNRAGKKLEPMNFGLGQLVHLGELSVDADGYPETFSVRDGVGYRYDPKARTLKKTAQVPPLYARPPEAVADFLKEANQQNRFLEVKYFEGVDLNGDGKADLAVGGFGSYGGASFGRYLIGGQDQTAALGLPSEGTPILVADLTGDGQVDVLIAAAARSGLYVNDGKGKFTLMEGEMQKFLANRGPYLHKVYVADLNQDGLPDLVLNNPRLGQVEIHENQGAGQFQRIVQARGWDADPVTLGDFNSDGLVDVAIGGPGDTITLYLNQTVAPGRSCQIVPRMAAPNPFAVGARVEVFKPGELGKADARPLWVEKAHVDGTPIHVGLGAQEKFDLRVTFPGQPPVIVERKGVATKGVFKITPDDKQVRYLRGPEGFNL